MSVNPGIHVGDIGTVMQFTVTVSGTAYDISNMVTKYFILRQPGGTSTTISANFVNSGTAGVVNFLSSSNTFDQMGKYQIQLYLANTSSAAAFHTGIYEFSVSSNLG